MPRNNDIDDAAVRDLPLSELRWLDRQPYLPAAIFGVTTWLVAGWPGLVIGFCWSTVAVWHATFSINSPAHLVGRSRYVTGDQSRNNWLLAFLTMGEGWHKNTTPTRHLSGKVFVGIRPAMLRALSWVGIVWDLHDPPVSVLRGEQKLGRLVIDKVAGQLAASFPVNVIANQVLDALAHAPGWTDLKSRFLLARVQAEMFWAEIDLPQYSTLDDVRRYARSRLAQTPSLDDIALSARERLLELVYSRLIEVSAPAATAWTSPMG